MLNASAFLIRFSPLRLFSDWRTLLQVPPDTNYSKRNGTQKQGEILPKEVQKIIQIEQYAKKYFFEIVSVAQFLYQNDTNHMFFLRSTSRARTKDPRLVARKESTRQPATPLCKSRARTTASCPTGMQVLIAVQQRVPRSLLSEQHSSLRIGSLSEDQRYKKCTRHLRAGKRQPRYKGYRARTTPCRKRGLCNFAKCKFSEIQGSENALFKAACRLLKIQTGR